MYYAIWPDRPIEQSYGIFAVHSLNTAAHNGDLPSANRKRDWGQITKWTVYSLLLINFGYYFIEEIYISSHTLRQGVLSFSGQNNLPPR